MKILVTGGTGFLGARLVSRLARSHDVAVLARHWNSDVPKGVQLFVGDIRDKNILRKAIEGCQVVYHLAASIDETSSETGDINVEGTRAVAAVCKELGVKQIVLMSSSGVLGETDKPAKENMPYNPKTDYEKSKMESEEIVISSGVPYTIVRAPIIIGPNMVWAMIFEAAKRKYPVIGSGENNFHLVYVDDVVSILQLVCNSRKALNQIFHVASKDIPTYLDVYRMISQELGIKMTDKHVPLWMAYMKSRLHTWNCKLHGRKPSLAYARSSIDRLVRNRIISTEKARAILDFEAKYDTRQAIHETIKYLRISRLGYSNYDIAEIQRVKDRGKL